MRPAVVSGIVIGDAHSDIGEFVFPVPSNIPRSVKVLNPGVISYSNNNNNNNISVICMTIIM